MNCVTEFLSHSLRSALEDDLIGDQRNLFIGDLSKECTEEELFTVFSQFGEVSEVLIKRSKMNGNPLGYGFVRMASHEAAKLTMDKLNSVLICGRAVRIGWAQRNCRLNLTCLPADVKAEEINQACKAYGEIFDNDTIIIPSLGILIHSSSDSPPVPHPYQSMNVR